MAKRLIHTPQPTDPGSEGGMGYEYQYHLAAGKCIKMLNGRTHDVVICEFHEDIMEGRRSDLGLDLHQVKKREAGSWTLSDLIKPEKPGGKSILAKLFEKLQMGKDVRSLSIEGYGRCAGSDDYSLPELILLLNAPVSTRDDDWSKRNQEYCDFLADKLKKQKIDSSTVEKAMGMLSIDFTYKHPHAIRSANEAELEEFLRSEFQVELTMPEVKAIYTDLYERVKQITLQPKQPWDVKSITRQAAAEIIYKRLKEYRPLATREQYQTLQEKLSSADLEEKVNYARESRIDSLILKYELDMRSSQWKRYKADINAEWQKFRRVNAQARGAELWKALLGVFENLGAKWVSQDARLDSEFVEGVFFDMTAVCETKWKN